MKSIFAVVAAALLLSAAQAKAQPAQGWTLRAGTGAILSPAFLGSRTYQVSAFPALRLAHGDRFFASVEEGVGYAVLSTSGWSAGPVLRVAFGRDEDGSGPFRIAGRRETALRGLGDVPTTVEAGAFARYRWGSWSVSADLRHGIGGHDALVGTLSGAHVWRFTSPVFDRGGPGIVSFGPRVSFAGRPYTSAYFGIDPGQSVRSGLAPYAPKGGLVSFGAGGVVVLPVAPRTSLTLLFGYDRLAAVAARSPLVRERGSRNQAGIGLFASYEFEL